MARNNHDESSLRRGGMEILNIYSWIFLDPLNFTNIYALLL